jgi:hypothetical protein
MASVSSNNGARPAVWLTVGLSRLGFVRKCSSCERERDLRIANESGALQGYCFVRMTDGALDASLSRQQTPTNVIVITPTLHHQRSPSSDSRLPSPTRDTYPDSSVASQLLHSLLIVSITLQFTILTVAFVVKSDDTPYPRLLA